MPPRKRTAVRKVFRAISRLDGFQCVRMEDFGARDREADDFCRARVAECDVFVGLIGHLFGSSAGPEPLAGGGTSCCSQGGEHCGLFLRRSQSLRLRRDERKCLGMDTQPLE